MAVRRLDQKYRIGHNCAGVSVLLPDGEVGPLVVLDTKLGHLAGGQLHVVFCFIQNVVGQSGGLLHRVDTRLQALHGDFAAVLGSTVNGMAGVLNGSDLEGDTIQGCTVRTGLNQLESGLLGIGENELRCVIGPEVDHTLGLVHHIAGTLHLRHHIGAGGEIGQVNFSAAIGGELLGAVAAVHSLNAEFHIGNGLGRIGAVHLYQLHTGLVVVEKHQFFGAAPGDKLDLLVAAVHDVALVSCVHLDRPVGAGLNAGQQDFTLALGFVAANGSAVAENFKGDAVHGCMALPVVFDHPKSHL